MMKEEVITKLEELLNTQHFGVLSTLRHDSPHATLICFAPTPDLKRLIFFSPEQTRKAINTQIYQEVSLFVDNRKNRPEDLFEATTLAAYGRIIDVDDRLKEEYQSYYLKKNPHMGFFLTPGVVMKIIDIDHFDLVSQFQTVLQAHPQSGSFEINVRQIQGKALQKGQVRGKFIAVGEISDDTDLSALIVQVAEDELDKVLGKNPLGIIVPEETELQSLRGYDGPVVKYNETIEIEEGTHMTLDGYLGVIILHQIK
jgi:hypothetical protein